VGKPSEIEPREPLQRFRKGEEQNNFTGGSSSQIATPAHRRLRLSEPAVGAVNDLAMTGVDLAINTSP